MKSQTTEGQRKQHFQGWQVTQIKRRLNVHPLTSRDSVSEAKDVEDLRDYGFEVTLKWQLERLYRQ